MRLSASDRRQSLLDAALDLFSRQGYQGTTTRQVADRAGITEALIFRHFPTKEDLYWHLLESRSRLRDVRPKIDRLFADPALDDEAIFTAIAADILRRNFKDDTLPRLLLFSALENHKLSDRFYRNNIEPDCELLAKHIQQRIRDGRFRKVDPLLAARGFIGMAFYHFMIQEWFGGKRFQKFEIEHVSQTLARIWLAGMSRELSGTNGTGPSSKKGRAANSPKPRRRT